MLVKSSIKRKMEAIWNPFSLLQVECSYLRQMWGRLHSLENIISNMIRSPNSKLEQIPLALLTLPVPPHELFFSPFFFLYYMKMASTSSSLQPNHSHIAVEAGCILQQPQRKHGVKLVYFLLTQGMILPLYLHFF